MPRFIRAVTRAAVSENGLCVAYARGGTAQAGACMTVLLHALFKNTQAPTVCP
jgi:hypothetical protein